MIGKGDWIVFVQKKRRLLMRNLSRPVHLNAPGGQMGEGGRLQHQRFHILDSYLGGKICFRTFISPYMLHQIYNIFGIIHPS